MVNTPKVNDHNIHTSSKALMCGAHRHRMTLFFVCDEVSWLSTKTNAYKARFDLMWNAAAQAGVRMDKRRANPCRKKDQEPATLPQCSVAAMLEDL